MFGGVGVNGFVVQQLALSVQADKFAACSETRIKPQHPFLAQWWSQEQLFEVAGKNADSLLVGSFFGHRCKFRLYGRFDQALVSVAYGFLDQVGAALVTLDEKPVKMLYTGLFAGADVHPEQAFPFASGNGQVLVGGAVLQGFAKLEIVFVIQRFQLFALDHGRRQDGCFSEMETHFATGFLVFGYPFGNDILGTLDGVFR